MIVHGVILSIPGHGGGLPIPERIVRERGLPGRYRHRLPRRERMAAVQVTLAGSGAVRAARGELAVPPGCCLAFRTDDELEYTAGPGGWEFLYANLHGEAALAMVGELTARHGPVLAADPRAPGLRRLAEFAAGEGLRTVGLDLASGMRLASDLLGHLVEANAPRRDPEQDLLQAAIAIFAADLSQPPAVAAVAAACGVSREHLSRLFRRQLGVAPASWLREERLRHAEILLRSTELSVAAIAAQSGFAAVNHFIAAFRARCGVTPAQWRRAAGN